MGELENPALKQDDNPRPDNRQPVNRIDEQARELLADPRYSLQQIREKMSPGDQPRVIKASYEPGQDRDPLEQARQCISDKKHDQANSILTDVLKQETGQPRSKPSVYIC